MHDSFEDAVADALIFGDVRLQAFERRQADAGILVVAQADEQAVADAAVGPPTHWWPSGTHCASRETELVRTPLSAAALVPMSSSLRIAGSSSEPCTVSGTTRL